MMGRRPCCDNTGLNKGAWTAEEDKKLVNFVITNNYKCSWRDVPKHAGLLRCGKSCRLRWVNYLSPDLKRGLLTEHEEKLVIDLHCQFGNKWSKIASHMPGRTDNEIKNLWNTHIKKKLSKMGIDPLTHKPLNADPPPDNHHDHYQSQEAELANGEETKEHHKDQQISLILEGSTITHADDQPAKEQELMGTKDGFIPNENNDNAFSIYEVPLIEPYKNTEDGFPTHEVLLLEPNENIIDGFSTPKVQFTESEGTLPGHHLPSSCSSTACSNTSASTTISTSTTNSILEDLKSLQSFEDWQSDGHRKICMENAGDAYEDDFIDWNWLINDFDIDTIDFELIKSLPDPITLQNNLG